MESRTGEATRLLYCTTGVLLRKLQEDLLLSNVSHVIVDEVSNLHTYLRVVGTLQGHVFSRKSFASAFLINSFSVLLSLLLKVHERSVQSDFLLIILREILHKRSDLHLVLMSATVDSEKFSSYFTHCPILRISGRSYPVEVNILTDLHC